MAKKVDVTGWLTTEQVARELGVKPRTIHHHVQAGNLHPQKFKLPGVSGGGSNMFDPAEIREYLQQRVDAKTEVLPAGGSAALVAARYTALDPVRIATALDPVRPATALTVPITDKVYLTLEEAAEFTGWGPAQLKQRCKGIPNGPRGKLIFRRADLLKL